MGEPGSWVGDGEQDGKGWQVLLQGGGRAGKGKGWAAGWEGVAGAAAGWACARLHSGSPKAGPGSSCHLLPGMKPQDASAVHGQVHLRRN